MPKKYKSYKRSKRTKSFRKKSRKVRRLNKKLKGGDPNQYIIFNFISNLFKDSDFLNEINQIRKGGLLNLSVTVKELIDKVFGIIKDKFNNTSQQLKITSWIQNKVDRINPDFSRKITEEEEIKKVLGTKIGITESKIVNPHLYIYFIHGLLVTPFLKDKKPIKFSLNSRNKQIEVRIHYSETMGWDSTLSIEYSIEYENK